MCGITSTSIITTIIIAIIAIIAIIIIEAMDCAAQVGKPPKRKMVGRRATCVEAQLWRLLQKAHGSRKQLLTQFSENQRLALERWVLAQPGGALKSPRRPKAERKNSSKSSQARTNIAGVPCVCSHRDRGKLRYDARVSCWPFRLLTQTTSDLPAVLNQLEVLLSVQQRFFSMPSDAWHVGAGDHKMRELKWKRFNDAIVAEFTARGWDLTLDAGIRFDAIVPANFLVGKRLATPAFVVSGLGLQQGHDAWQFLYSARSIVHGRTNRFTSLANSLSQEGLEKAWQRFRAAYTEVWQAAGHNTKRLSSQLAALERRFEARSKKRSIQCPRLGHVQQKVIRLLHSWTPLDGRPRNRAKSA